MGPKLAGSGSRVSGERVDAGAGRGHDGLRCSNSEWWCLGDGHCKGRRGKGLMATSGPYSVPCVRSRHRMADSRRGSALTGSAGVATARGSAGARKANDEDRPRHAHAQVRRLACVSGFTSGQCSTVFHGPPVSVEAPLVPARLDHRFDVGSRPLIAGPNGGPQLDRAAAPGLEETPVESMQARRTTLDHP